MSQHERVGGMDERWKRRIGGICRELEAGASLEKALDTVMFAHASTHGVALSVAKFQQFSDEFYLHFMEGEQDPSSPWAPAARQIRALAARNEAKRNNRLEARNRELEAVMTALKGELAMVYTRGWFGSVFLFAVGFLAPLAIAWLKIKLHETAVTIPVP